MYQCVRCDNELVELSSNGIYVSSCCECEGKLISFDSLMKTSVAEYVKELFDISRSGNCIQRIPCPSCSSLMYEVMTTHSSKMLIVDCCNECRLMWFDRYEYEQIARNKSFTRGRVGLHSESKREFLNLTERPRARFEPHYYDEKINDINADREEAEDDGFAEFSTLLTYLGIPIEKEVSQSLPFAFVVRGLSVVAISLSIRRV